MYAKYKQWIRTMKGSQLVVLGTTDMPGEQMHFGHTSSVTLK